MNDVAVWILLVTVVIAVAVGLFVLNQVVRIGTRRPRPSLDCLGGQHEACKASGGCDGCICHFFDEAGA